MDKGNNAQGMQGMALDREDCIQRYVLGSMERDERAAFEPQLQADAELAKDIAITAEAVHCLRRLSDRRMMISKMAASWAKIDEEAEDEFLSESGAQ